MSWQRFASNVRKFRQTDAFKDIVARNPELGMIETATALIDHDAVMRIVATEIERNDVPAYKIKNGIRWKIFLPKYQRLIKLGAPIYDERGCQVAVVDQAMVDASVAHCKRRGFRK